MAEGTIVGLYGTLGVPDTVDSNTATIYEIGEDRIWANLQMVLAAHNRTTRELMDLFVERTTEKLMRYGAAPRMDMDEYDEHGTPDAQKVMTGSLAGFPLRKYGRSLGWTKTYFQETTGAEFNAQVTAMLDADTFNVARQLKRALFRPTNYNFVDHLVRENTTYPLPVKALVNGDGAPIPPDPNGNPFDPATHTHYLAVATANTLLDAELTSGLTTVLEHFRSGSPLILINKAQEGTVRGFTSNFTEVVDSEIVQPTTAKYVRGGLDMIQTYNRRIGRYAGADVWVKPWVPAGYVLIVMTGQEKVLAWRYSPRKPDDFVLVNEDELHNLRCRSYERNFGLGVYNRVGAAVIDTLHTTYTAPPVV